MSLRKTGAVAQEIESQIKEEVEARKQNKGTPIRFRVPAKTEENKFAVITILDDITDIQDLPRYWEHNVYNQQNPKASFNALCTAELGHCDLCEKGENRSFITFLTVANYMNKYNESTDGKYYRQLLPIKEQSKTDYYQYFKIHLKKYGTLRGLTLFVLREEAGQKFPTIGQPSIPDDTCPYQSQWEEFFVSDDDLPQQWVHVDEDFIAEEFYTPALSDRDGNVYQQENSELEAYDYDEVFPEPDMNKNKGKIRANTPVSKKPKPKAPASKTPPKVVREYAPAEEDKVEEEDPYADVKAQDKKSKAKKAAPKAPATKAPPKGKKPPKGKPEPEDDDQEFDEPDEAVDLDDDDLDALFDVEE